MEDHVAVRSSKPKRSTTSAESSRRFLAPAFSGRTSDTTTLSLIYRLGMESGKVQATPAKRLKTEQEDNERVRFVNSVHASRDEAGIPEAVPGRSDSERVTARSSGW